MVAKCDLTFNNPVLLYIWLSPYVSLTSLENICEIAGHDRDVTLPLRVLQQKKKLYIWHNLTSSKKNKEKKPFDDNDDVIFIYYFLFRKYWTKVDGM